MGIRIWFLNRRGRRKMSAIESMMYDEALASATTPEAKASLSDARRDVRGLLRLGRAPKSLYEEE